MTPRARRHVRAVINPETKACNHGIGVCHQLRMACGRHFRSTYENKADTLNQQYMREYQYRE